jgi:hypothetical protein
MQQGSSRTIYAREQAISKLPAVKEKGCFFLSTPVAYERYQQIR